MPFSNLRKPELLSPAGSIEAVKAAIANGCDAIYLGGKQFNARAFAANFDNQQLEEVCDYAHLRRVKIYVTVNTLYKDSEFAELAQFIDQLSQMGVDGLIMQDLGAISFVRANFPDLPVHASTQLTSNSLDDVLFYQDLGVRTVVMSRELSIEEVRRCVENSHINIEVFVHGALCVGYSGQCLFSSLLGDRSGNRGKCAQGCRMYYQLAKGEQKYDEGYLISTKDICTLELLPQLIEAGVASFKIEGRMKSPQYVGLVTSIYRYYIDLYFKDPQHYSVRREDVERLLQIFNREGFSSGYFKTHSGLDMMSKNSPKDTGLRIGTVERYDVRNQKVQIRLEKPLHKADGIAIGTYGCGINQDYNANQLITLPFEGRCRSGDIVYRTFDKKLNDEVSAHLTGQFHYLQLKAYASFRSDQKAYLKLCDDNGHCVEAYGETVQKALKQPVGSDRIREQLLKTGNTVYQISELQIETDEDIFMPLSQINQLRAKACEMMDETIIRSYKRKPAAYRLDSPQERGRSKKAFSALVATSQQLEAVCRYPQITRVYMQMNGEMMNELDEKISAIHQSGKQAYMALPRIMRDYISKNYDAYLKAVEESRADGYLVATPGAYQLVRGSRKKKQIDFTANCFNSKTVDFWRIQGADGVTMSVEMSAEQIAQVADESCEQIIYGYLPMMVTHQCPVGNYLGNKKNRIYCEKRKNSSGYYLINQNGLRFPLVTDCDNCLCTILNNKPLVISDSLDEISENAAALQRFQFTLENMEQTEKIIEGYLNLKEGLQSPDLQKIEGVSGHYFREVL